MSTYDRIVDMPLRLCYNFRDIAALLACFPGRGRVQAA